jgi:hypothetical protein
MSVYSRTNIGVLFIHEAGNEILIFSYGTPITPFECYGELR